MRYWLNRVRVWLIGRVSVRIFSEFRQAVIGACLIWWRYSSDRETVFYISISSIITIVVSHGKSKWFWSNSIFEVRTFTYTHTHVLTVLYSYTFVSVNFSSSKSWKPFYFIYFPFKLIIIKIVMLKSRSILCLFCLNLDF